MRKDMQAMLQMTGQFASHDEQQTWDENKKEISSITHSFSGEERNRLFLNSHAEQFFDVSGLSGLDSPADGRVLVRLDYDRDGWPDFAVVNSSRPFLQLYRNQLGESRSPAVDVGRDSAAAGNQFIAIRFVGGNSSASRSTQSSRDGWGAKVVVTLGQNGRERTLFREHLCGEGMAGQNSSTMLIGIGTAPHAERIEVRWPSKTTQTVPRVKAGSLVTVFENPRDEPYVIEVYRRSAERRTTERVEVDSTVRRFDIGPHSSSELTVVTTMASWCAACARHQPLLRFLPNAFEKGEIGVVGFPIDRGDSTEALREFAARHQATYRLILEPAVAQRDAIESILEEAGGTDALPSSIVTDQSGRVLLVQSGIPTVSRLRQLLAISRDLKK